MSLLTLVSHKEQNDGEMIHNDVGLKFLIETLCVTNDVLTFTWTESLISCPVKESQKSYE